MRHLLTCKTCNRFLGEFDLERPEDITNLLLQTHTTGNHSGAHSLEITPIALGDVKLQLTCKNAGCQYFEKEETYYIAAYYVPAIAVMFHARNEGHKFVMKINGKEIEPLTEDMNQSGLLPETPVKLPDPEPPHAEYGGTIRKINVTAIH